MVIREVSSVFKALLPFLLSHHPLCSFYKDDTYALFGRRFCLGCSITYPTAILVAVLVLVTGIYRLFPEPIFHQSLLLAFSVLLGVVHMVKYRNRFKGLKMRVAVKAALGFSIAGSVVWILTFPTNWPVVLLFFILFLVLFSFMGTFRLYYFQRICAGCIYHGDWDLCFGFRGLNRYHAIKSIGRKRRLYLLMFDREKRKTYPIREGPTASADDYEPDLADNVNWLYTDGKKGIPWVPEYYPEIDRIGDIPA
jgi:hypothetical protein